MVKWRYETSRRRNGGFWKNGRPIGWNNAPRTCESIELENSGRKESNHAPIKTEISNARRVAGRWAESSRRNAEDRKPSFRSKIGGFDERGRGFTKGMSEEEIICSECKKPFVQKFFLEWMRNLDWKCLECCRKLLGFSKPIKPVTIGAIHLRDKLEGLEYK